MRKFPPTQTKIPQPFSFFIFTRSLFHFVSLLVQFFFGDDPHSLDLKAFVWLALIVNVDKEIEFPLRTFMEDECKNLVGVYNRVKVRIHFGMCFSRVYDCCR